ncbi:hypothetical protein MN086_03180 [Sulfurovum sp. XGS-02]|uniref:hypothetical protein n=1 Tax=Sulfurovum sp. XGS-02 TaxID=2925411 RepID=UPI0020575275|nr:hypothetical protein [Sulfurovum sp. XGS-02]UPT78157.1 hypothetical protein MN086_03180 [Sulfurovum sp. XGS-02]
MLQADMKSVIKYAIELDIDYIKSFLGYEGDKVLEFITKKKEVVELIESYANNLGLDCKHEFEIAGEHGPSYNIFIGVEDPSVFKLKK